MGEADLEILSPERQLQKFWPLQANESGQTSSAFANQRQPKEPGRGRVGHPGLTLPESAKKASPHLVLSKATVMLYSNPGRDSVK